MSFIRLCSVLFLAVLLGSCASAPTGPPKLVAAVTHHHGFGSSTGGPGTKQFNVGSGENLRIVAWGSAQTNNLRHVTYKKLIAAKLQASGFRIENSRSVKSRYIARFRYWDGRSRVSTSQSSTTVGTAGQLVDVQGALIWLPGESFNVPTSKTTTTFIRNVVVEIFDTNDMAIRSKSKHKSPKKMFEGYVVSEGKSASVHDVIKSLIDAMFQKFPAPNGERRVISVVFRR